MHSRPWVAETGLGVGGRTVWAWLLCDDLPMARGIEAAAFLLEVEVPVVVQVAAEEEGTQLDHGLGPGQAPAHSRSFHSIFDQVLAGSFHTAAGDRQPLPQVLVVLH